MTEDLLKPRYKVIDRWPGMQVPVGHILKSQYRQNGKSYQPQDYPGIFQPLQWWEERKPEEIGWIQYLVWKKKTDQPYPFKMMKLNHERRIAVWNNQGYGPPLIECEPITESEYNEYLKTLTHP